MHIEPFTIKPPDGIACTFGIVQSDTEDQIPAILVAAFSGVYPDGSYGNSHGHYIAYSTVHGLAAIDPYGLILDFRELEYRWGNTLLLVFEYVSRFMDYEEESEPKFPIVVVTSDKCTDAFLSLVTPTGKPVPQWHFDDMTAAIEYSIREANRWMDA